MLRKLCVVVLKIKINFVAFENFFHNIFAKIMLHLACGTDIILYY